MIKTIPIIDLGRRSNDAANREFYFHTDMDLSEGISTLRMISDSIRKAVRVL